MASADTGKAPAASSPPEKSSAVQEKKRKSGKAASSQKLASATKKERIKEIDRVRTGGITPQELHTSQVQWFAEDRVLLDGQRTIIFR